MTLALGKVFEPFVEQRPICVMARGVLEYLFNAERIDALFARTAKVQYTRAVLFSSVVDLLGQVVLGVQPGVPVQSMQKVPISLLCKINGLTGCAICFSKEISGFLRLSSNIPVCPLPLPR